MRNEKGQFVKGHKLGMSGLHHSEKTKIKIRESNVGKKRSVETIEKIRSSHKGIHSSPLTEFNTERVSGSKNVNWKGGITPLKNQIRNCFESRQWRSDVFQRDNYVCVLCGKRGGPLEVDHYPKMFSTIFHENKIKDLGQALECEEFWNINNGRTLCRKCHDKTKKNVWP